MEPEKWEIDSGHSGIYFSVCHMMLAKVRGQFTRWSGSIVVPNGDIHAAMVSILVDATSLSTGLEERDAHLGSAIRRKMFSYEDLVRLQAADLQRVLREAASSDLATAMKSARRPSTP